MIRALKNKIKDLPFQSLSISKNLNPNAPISIFADPRSGSTWLAESFNQIPNSLIIDEPLHLGNTKQFPRLNFGWRQFIPDDENWNEAYTVFEKLLRGKILNAKLSYRNSWKEAMLAEQLILKIIRGKGILPWLVSQFDLIYKPIVIVRHPFDMVASMMKHGAWNYDFEKFKIPKTPYNEIYKTHKSFFEKLSSKEEQLVALWCLSNNHVLKHSLNNTKWISLNYEQLITNPEESFSSIFSEWNLQKPNNFFSHLEKPSSTTIGKTSIDRKKQIGQWKDQLSKNQIEKLMKVLSYFEVNYYSDSKMPIISADKIHLKSK